MILLGVDPGFRFAGFGILKKEGSRVTVLDYGCLALSQKESLSCRTGLFYRFFQEKIMKYGVTAIALETSFLGKNAQNFLKLGYLRGILYLLADQHKAELFEFPPTKVKQALTGFGMAQKDQVARVIQRLFPLLNKEILERNDVTDALAIALCGIWQATSRPVIQKSIKAA